MLKTVSCCRFHLWAANIKNSDLNLWQEPWEFWVKVPNFTPKACFSGIFVECLAFNKVSTLARWNIIFQLCVTSTVPILIKLTITTCNRSHRVFPWTNAVQGMLGYTLKVRAAPPLGEVLQARLPQPPQIQSLLPEPNSHLRGRPGSSDSAASFYSLHICFILSFAWVPMACAKVRKLSPGREPG